MATKKVVIVGAGYAGVKAALTLNKKKKKDELEITLIDKHDYHTLLTELHEVAGNRVGEDAVKVPLRDIFRYTDVRVVRDDIKSFDFDNHEISSDKRKYKYDYLVIAIGSEPNFYGVSHVDDVTFTLWSFEDAVAIRDHVLECFRQAAVEEDEREIERLLTFVVAGAGFTGVEMIGELAHWTRDLAREYDIDYKKVRLVIVDMLPSVLGCLDEKSAKKAHRYMEKKLGIEVMLNTRVQNITREGFSTGDKFIRTNTIIWAAGITANDAAACMFAKKAVKSGRIAVDEYCRTEHKNVYAIGDVCGLTDEHGMEYPAMVETAIQTAEGAAKNILNSIRNRKPEKVEVKLHGNMVSVGNYYAVSQIMGRTLPAWLSMIMKYLVNIHYLWEIASFRGVRKYVYHEFLERKQRKILPEKHWSTRMQVWWLVPLRMFFGVMWLWEGIRKIYEGWFAGPKLASFLGMASDGISGATPSGLFVRRIDEIFNFDIKLFHFMIGKESRLVEGKAIASDIFAKLELLHIGDFNLVDWILRNIVLANDTISMIFQVLVVILEIAAGLMLLGGAFTFAGGLISFALMGMFITSTGLYEKSWWMIFASIAVMGGAGRAFGLDYYLLPYLNNLWDRFRKSGKLGLFFRHSLHRDD